MKNSPKVILTLSMLLAVFVSKTIAQEEKVIEVEDDTSAFSVGVDLASSYVWRGIKLGGPALQPLLEYSTSGLTVGVWGSFGLGPANEAVNEADLYISYGFDFGLSLGVTDYYAQGAPYFQYSDTISSHAFELNAGYKIKDFSISANYILNNAKDGIGSLGGDIYFEIGYGFKNFNIFIGAGNGWYTSTNKFEVCNIGISASKQLKFTEKFSIPVSGFVSVNPQLETFNIVGIISF